MKFIFADSLDMVDPGYDFLNDRNALKRKVYWDDAYPHEMLSPVPYAGILVSRGIVGDTQPGGKYSQAQAMRLKREGVRRFFRLEDARFDDMLFFGDCGAFTYVRQDVPPYTPADTAAFYDACGFTHGCSVDHIIFDFDDAVSGLKGGSALARERFDITLENAEAFFGEARHAARLTPLGVIQGWSPDSMAEAARRLVAMGYNYLAVGGMVPLRPHQIKQCLRAIRSVIPAETSLHVLGFAKADDIHEFTGFGITSFDTTSPLIRAFKDSRANYWLADETGRMRYYTALRVPQALENTKLKNMVKRGDITSETLTHLERASLDALRAFAAGRMSVSDCLSPVLAYNALFTTGQSWDECSGTSAMQTLARRYQETLEDRPWEHCGCNICRKAGIDVIIYRASNRNKRRGMHNLSVFNTLVNNLNLREQGCGETI